MKLDAPDLRDLADFLGRRFPASVDRAALAVAARVPLPEDDSEERWRAVVSWAHDKGTLPRMVSAAARMKPEDAELAKMAALLPNRRRWPLVLVGALVGGVALWFGRDRVPEPVVQPSEVVKQAVTPVEIPPAPVPEPTPAPVADVTTKQTVTPVENEPAIPVAAVERAAPTTSRCAGSPGSVLGYWYSGSTAPGEAGQTITLKGGATVRADYPRPENHFNFRTEIRCNLVAGDQVRLSQAPIPIAGGAVWVPFVGGDLVVAHDTP